MTNKKPEMTQIVNIGNKTAVITTDSTEINDNKGIPWPMNNMNMIFPFAIYPPEKCQY